MYCNSSAFAGYWFTRSKEHDASDEKDFKTYGRGYQQGTRGQGEQMLMYQFSCENKRAVKVSEGSIRRGESVLTM